MPMTLTQTKRVIRQMRTELSEFSKEDLVELTWMHIQFKDGVPKEARQLYLLRKHLAQRMLNTQLGLKRKSSIERMLEAKTSIWERRR